MFPTFRSAFVLVLPAAVAAFACSGSGVTIGELDASATGDGGNVVAADGGTGADGNVAQDGAIVGPKVSIYVRATAATFPHNDGLPSLQPTDARLWIRNLSLDFANGPTGVKIFDLATPKETPINDKSETLIAEVPIATLPTGTAVQAHVATDAVAYRVPTKLHFNNMVLDGEINGWQAFSNGAIDPVQKQARQSGYFTVDFLLGGNKVASNSGDNAPLPTGPVGGGFTLTVSGGVGSYSFPITLPVSNAVTTDRKMYITLNVDHNFRWVDQKKADYVDGAWDTDPPAFEQVARFGANSFTLTLE